MTSDDVRAILKTVSNASQSTWKLGLTFATLLMGEILLEKISARERREEIEKEAKGLPDAPAPFLPSGQK